MIKERVYKYKNYQISYDEGLKDRSGLVIGTKEKDTLYITAELYDESANAVIKILDNLQKQIQLKDIEIEEIKKELNNQSEYIELLKKEYANQLQQKENILKEVREYFKNHTLKYDDLMLIKPSDVLEILDKENK